jgi:hypothetical protein
LAADAVLQGIVLCFQQLSLFLVTVLKMDGVLVVVVRLVMSGEFPEDESLVASCGRFGVFLFGFKAQLFLVGRTSFEGVGSRSAGCLSAILVFGGAAAGCKCLHGG